MPRLALACSSIHLVWSAADRLVQRQWHTSFCIMHYIKTLLVTCCWQMELSCGKEAIWAPWRISVCLSILSPQIYWIIWYSFRKSSWRWVVGMIMLVVMMMMMMDGGGDDNQWGLLECCWRLKSSGMWHCYWVGSYQLFVGSHCIHLKGQQIQ